MPITVIIPALNEEISIGSMVIKTKKYANHVIVVDDGSTDNTAEIARIAGAYVIIHAKNGGKGEALKTGFREACKNGTKVIVTIDADGQRYSSEIPKIVSPILSKEADMVTCRYDGINDSSGFRSFATHSISNFKFGETGLSIEKEMLTDATNAGLKIKEIDIDVGPNHKEQRKKKTKNGVKTIAALPAHNEENYIAKVILGCRDLVDEVIVVDDGSKDATSNIARALGAVVIEHDVNRGYGAAIKTCFNTAKERNADLMVILDSDGQHDPRDIIDVMKPMNSGSGIDIVIGSRFISHSGNSVSTYRKIGMKVLDFTTIKTGSSKVSDSQSGFRAYSKKAIDQISLNGNNGMFVGSEILFQAKELGLKIFEVPITCRYDQGESSQNPVSHGLSVLTGIFGRLVYKKPLLFTFAGISFLIFGGFVGFWIFQGYIEKGNDLPFGPTMMLLLFIILGSLSIFSGLILHSMRNIAKEVKNEK